MAPRTCALCHTARAMLKRPKTGQQICKDCFLLFGALFKTHHCPEARDSQVAFKPSTAVVLCNA
ncbi:hypothetical protein BDZ89DRAFT_1073144 [Hymenopellis radicata]|nr:hypothetical protein BDZ89DRAFT_1073144 [Hymenopellis radicata]